ncbi:MAG TPA: hypothetical protein VFV99_31590 [Kofleriaceae bacterium]|nr:hypothetical protein [Kofleriaceae bacterium]
MLASLPGDAKLIFAVDVTKLRHSPIAQRGWSLLRELPMVDELIGTMCGALDDVKYALVGLEDADGHKSWGWLHGVNRDAKLTCTKAVEQQKLKQTKSFSRGDYSLETSTTSTTEILWLDATTAFYFQHAPDDKLIGEPELRRVLAAGGGFTQGDLATLLDHVDFESGLVMVGDGAMTKQPGIGGLAFSIEADAGLRAQAYVQLENEDRASGIQSQMRAVLAQLVKNRMLESAEARAEGKGLAASIEMTGAQFDWWIELALAKAKDPNAPIPPPPSAN